MKTGDYFIAVELLDKVEQKVFDSKGIVKSRIKGKGFFYKMEIQTHCDHYLFHKTWCICPISKHRTKKSNITYKSARQFNQKQRRI
jgi:hypothetical protein